MARLPRPFDDYRIFVLLATLALSRPHCSSRIAPRAARSRRCARREPAHGARGLVRDGGCAGSARARARLRAARSRAPDLGGREPRRRACDEAVRARRRSLLRGHAADARRPPTGVLPRGRGLRRSLPRLRPAVPNRRSRCTLERHRRLRRRHVSDHRLRARGAPAQRRRHRRPLRLLPLRPARARALAAGHCLVLWSQRGPQRCGPAPRGFRFRCSSSCS